MDGMNLLLVEDEVVLRQGLVDLLHNAGHAVEVAGNGPEAVAKIDQGTYDLVLLDVMLPGFDGIEVCRRIRPTHPALPILMLTAKGSENDKVRGLKAGADDYVTKPFGARELLARVEALGRRVRAVPTAPELLKIDGCTLDLGRLEAIRGRQTVTLTAREGALIRWLHRHRTRAVTRAELLEQVWNLRPDTETRTVDMTIANLRSKIERNPADPQIVVCVKGVGYAWGHDQSR
jgi:two-component system response regulator RegX3